MKNLKEYIQEDHKFLVKSLPKSKKEHLYFPKDRWELIDIIEDRIKNEGPNCDLNDVDVSKLTNMCGLFADSDAPGGSSIRQTFDGDISSWDVSNVRDMYSMFRGGLFDGDISQWDVSNATDMGYMFLESSFTGDISDWNVTIKEKPTRMFDESPLEKNPPKWYIDNWKNNS